MLGWQECVGLGWENNPALSGAGRQKKSATFLVWVHFVQDNGVAKIQPLLYHHQLGWGGPSSKQLKSEHDAHSLVGMWWSPEMKISKFPDCPGVLCRTHITAPMLFPQSRKQKMIYTNDLCHSESHKGPHECQRLMQGHSSAGYPALLEMWALNQANVEGTLTYEGCKTDKRLLQLKVQNLPPCWEQYELDEYLSCHTMFRRVK